MRSFSIRMFARNRWRPVPSTTKPPAITNECGSSLEGIRFVGRTGDADMLNERMRGNEKRAVLRTGSPIGRGVVAASRYQSESLPLCHGGIRRDALEQLAFVFV